MKAHRLIKPHKFWANKSNQREFLDSIAKKFNITSPQQWGNIGVRTLQENGGNGILKLNGNSLLRTLRSVYTDINWNLEWFYRYPPHYWENRNNQKNFVNALSRKLKLKKPSDWGNVKTKTVIDNGGLSLLYQNRGSIFQMLKSVHPEWKREWFQSRNSKNYWESLENQRNFLDSLSIEYGIEGVRGWNKITLSLLKKHGGNQLLKKYQNSIINIIQSVYGKNVLLENANGLSKNHIGVLQNVQKLFPNQ